VAVHDSNACSGPTWREVQRQLARVEQLRQTITALLALAEAGPLPTPSARQEENTEGRAAGATRPNQRHRQERLPVQEAGSKGGSRVLQAYGVEPFRRLGQLGGSTVKAERGVEYYRTLGKQGGGALRARRGLEYYRAISKRGGDSLLRQRGAEFFRAIGRLGGQRGWRLDVTGPSGTPAPPQGS